ncbi:hypothetical protein [Runella salmonicolor]|uniref:Terminase n=1 Tax=Runella salmonicolor TaxID=2950278 RepID=A0ABT1FVN8_9BACT|nr:hypothetical protein [Runella salmonicolor]MCP1384838.1 hypothetical protein [Runella salmonicolor]
MGAPNITPKIAAKKRKVKIKFSPLVGYQRKIVDSPVRFTITEASTKVGKTYSHIVWLITLAALEGKDGRNYWWIAPVYSQSEIAYNRLKRYLAPLGNLARFNSQKMTITLWNKAVIWFKSADSPDSLYGEDVYGAVFDEFTRAKKEAYYALRSTITKTKAKVKFIGNKTHPEHWGTKLAEDAEKGLLGNDWAYFKIDAYEAASQGIIDIEEIEKARRELPEDIFMSLYLVQWILLNGNPYFRHFDKKVMVDSPENPIQYDKRYPVYFSFDFNKRNTCLVLQKINGRIYVIEEYYMLGGHGEDLEELIKILCMKYGRNQIFCTGDASGNNASALTTGNASAWMLIDSYFKKYKAAWVNFDRVPTYNLGTETSRMIVNALLKYYHGNFVVSYKCTTLLSDINRMSVLNDGKLNKKECDENDFGHVGDCLRYAMTGFEYDTFTKLGYDLA